MNVEQLIAALQKMPKEAVVLLEGDSGYSDEVILLPSMEDD